MALRTAMSVGSFPTGRPVERPIIFSKRRERPRGMTVKEAETAGEKPQPSFMCDICGPEKPAAQVFQCTVCLKSFCIAHLGTWNHDCYINE